MLTKLSITGPFSLSRSLFLLHLKFVRQSLCLPVAALDDLNELVRQWLAFYAHACTRLSHTCVSVCANRSADATVVESFIFLLFLPCDFARISLPFSKWLHIHRCECYCAFIYITYVRLYLL